MIRKHAAVAALLALSLAGCAAPAQLGGPDRDGRVVASLRAVPGADNFDDSEFISNAHRVCDNDGDTHLTIQELAAYGFNPAQIDALIAAARKEYCPK